MTLPRACLLSCLDRSYLHWATVARALFLGDVRQGGRSLSSDSRKFSPNHGNKLSFSKHTIECVLNVNVNVGLQGEHTKPPRMSGGQHGKWGGWWAVSYSGQRLVAEMQVLGRSWIEGGTASYSTGQWGVSSS